MSTVDLLNKDTQTVLDVVNNSSFQDSIKFLLRELIEGLSLDMNSIDSLINIIKDNNLDSCENLQDIITLMNNTNDKWYSYNIILGNILTYLHTFASENTIPEVINLRSSTINSILSEPKSTI